jgi:hypothetical protein
MHELVQCICCLVDQIGVFNYLYLYYVTVSGVLRLLLRTTQIFFL